MCVLFTCLERRRMGVEDGERAIGILLVSQLFILDSTEKKLRANGDFSPAYIYFYILLRITLVSKEISVISQMLQ